MCVCVCVCACTHPSACVYRACMWVWLGLQPSIAVSPLIVLQTSVEAMAAGPHASGQPAQHWSGATHTCHWSARRHRTASVTSRLASTRSRAEGTALPLGVGMLCTHMHTSVSHACMPAALFCKHTHTHKQQTSQPCLHPAASAPAPNSVGVTSPHCPAHHAHQPGAACCQPM